MSPLVFVALIIWKPLIIYFIAFEDSFSAILAQTNEDTKENALYYLSYHLIPTKASYPSMEKHCLVIIFLGQKL